VLALAAIALYGAINNYPWQNPQMATAAPADHGNAGGAGSMEEATAALEARLAANPNDAEGWRMLGRTYLVSGNPQKAAAAYDRAQSLSATKDPGLQLDIAEALVLGGDPAQQPRARQIVAEALAADPNSQKALWYQGVMAARGGDTETAKASWLKLVEQDPPAEIREVIVSQLRELGVEVPGAPGAKPAMAAMGGMGAAGPMGGAGAGQVAPKGRTVRVTVKLDPSLSGQAQPGLPLFVSAREPGIPGPPIAALRLTTDALPATVVLSDANTMIEGRDLSSVGDVEIVARVAVGGDVTPRSGDLLGRAVQKKGGGEDLEVVISQVQP
ncbi:MAG TPA: tetratricopeptide repeat protein, partial [Steroidobacteraceae bacterium]|nr:tetratricopeptide repeat protein [Steroidobacteraceae bacterium]